MLFSQHAVSKNRSDFTQKSAATPRGAKGSNEPLASPELNFVELWATKKINNYFLWPRGPRADEGDSKTLVSKSIFLTKFSVKISSIGLFKKRDKFS